MTGATRGGGTPREYHGWEGDRFQHPSRQGEGPGYPQAAFRLPGSTWGSFPTPAPGPRSPHGGSSPLRPKAPSSHSGLLPHVPTRGLCSTPAPVTFPPHGSLSSLEPQAPAPPCRTRAVSPAVPRVPPAPDPALTTLIRYRPASAAPGPAPTPYWRLPPRPSIRTTTPSVPRARAPADSQSGAGPPLPLPYTGAGAGRAVTFARGAPHCGGEAVARGGRQGALRGPARPQSRPAPERYREPGGGSGSGLAPKPAKQPFRYRLQGGKTPWWFCSLSAFRFKNLPCCHTVTWSEMERDCWQHHGVTGQGRAILKKKGRALD